MTGSTSRAVLWTDSLADQASDTAAQADPVGGGSEGRFSVVAIHVAPATRLPMKAVTEVEAEAGRGLIGDRYHGSKHRHVTVQSAVALADAAADLGRSVDPGTTRRNITVSGPAGGDVPSRPGDRIRIGSVDLEVVRIAAPCKLLDDAIGDGARNALRRRAGSVCRLLTSGSISIGDPVVFTPRNLAQL